MQAVTCEPFQGTETIHCHFAGLMLVYCVVIGDVLVGKPGYLGLLCSSVGGVLCNRPLVVGLVTLIVLIPAVSFR